MANTYTSLFYHLVFSTKHRLPLVHPDIEQRVWSYIGGIARAHNLTALQVGGIETHIHALYHGEAGPRAERYREMGQVRLIEMDT